MSTATKLESGDDVRLLTSRSAVTWTLDDSAKAPFDRFFISTGGTAVVLDILWEIVGERLFGSLLTRWWGRVIVFALAAACLAATVVVVVSAVR